MNADLQGQLRRYGDRFETVLAALETEAQTMTVTTQPQTVREGATQHRRPAWAIAVAAFFVTTLAVGGVVVMMQGSGDTAPAESGSFTVYGPAEGLPDGCSWDLSAEPVGTWAGGDCGLYRLDGDTWRAETELNHTVTDLAVAPDGSVWVTHSGGGVAVFDGETLVEYDTPLELIAITADGTAWGRLGLPELVRFDGQTWQPAPEAGPIGELVIGADGTLWGTVAEHPDREEPGTSTAGTVRHLSPDGWTTHDPAPGVFGDLVPAPGGVAYLVDGEMYRFDGTGWTFEPIPPIPSLRDMSIDLVTTEEGSIDTWEINDQLISEDGHLWLVSTIYGALEFVDGTWIHYSADDGLATDALFSLEQGPDGSIWFTSEDAGPTRRWP